MALSIATEGRVKAVGRKWNLVPHWDNLALGPQGLEHSIYGTVGEAPSWKKNIPEGIIHWTDRSKPWHLGTKVWRPDLWESEETSWEALRNGWWEKPVAALMEPRSRKEVASLARRGWNVHVFQRAGFPAIVDDAPLAAGLKMGSKSLPEEEKDEAICVNFPDVHFHAYSSDEDGVSAMVTHIPEATAFLKIGPGAGLSAILGAANKLPETLVLQGPLTARKIKSVHAQGYDWESRLKRDEWPAGGPDPSVLSYSRHIKAAVLDGAEDVYLRRSVG